MDVLPVLLLAGGVGLLMLCCAALPLVRNPYARLHVASLAGIGGPVAVALAVLVERPGVTLGLHAMIFALLAIGSGAAATHALARALRLPQSKSLSDHKVPP